MKSSSKNNLRLFQNNIKRIVTLSLFVSFIVFLSLSISAYIINKNIQYQSAISSINNANKILQSNISSQLMVIANSPEFIRYLRSGNATRKSKHTDIQWLFAKLNNEVIKGIVIKDEHNHEILSYGVNTRLFTSLYLCYLGDVYDSNLGICDDTLKVYIDEEQYIKQLHTINPSITQAISATNHYDLNVFSNKFGLFKASSGSKQFIKLGFNLALPKMFILFIIGIILLFIVSFYLSHKYINKIICKNLINPLKYLQDGYIKNSISLSTNDDFLDELNNLVRIINVYNHRIITHKVDLLSEELAHKLNNPLNGIMSIMPKIIQSNNSSNEVILLKNYINTIYNLTATILENFRSQTSELFNNSKSEDKLINLSACIKNICDEFKISKPSCNYNFKIDTHPIWIKSVILEFEDLLMNLLNNSYESLTQSSHKLITVSTTYKNNFWQLTLTDSGCGIPRNEINNVLSGKSLKHKGKGIGLQSAIKYINNLGGSFDLSSTVGNGTNIEITIPYYTQPIWLVNIIQYNNDTSFIIIGRTSTITKCQKILSHLDNKKLYFISFKDYASSSPNLSISVMNMIFITDENIIIDMPTNLCNKESIYIIVYDQLLKSTQEMLISHSNINGIVYDSISESSFENIQ